MIARRYFLKSAGLSAFGLGFVPSFLRRAAFALEGAPAVSTRKVLIAVFMRGAADGLNIVVPFGEKDYYRMRPTIAIPTPSRSAAEGQAGIDLDGFFAFHPKLAALKPLYDAGHLAAIHAVGSPASTRSHFDAQDYMESGTPGVKATDTGWLNRYLQSAPEAEATPFRAVAVQPLLPRSLEGRAPALALQDARNFHLAFGPGTPMARSMEGAFEALYASASDPLMAGTARETFNAVEALQNIGRQPYLPENGVQYPRSPLGHHLEQVAQLIKSGLGLEIAFVDVGGWDHHVNEGGAEGQLGTRLKDLAESLAAFHKDMGERMADVVVLTMSEFGRTARENGNRGTDHGHANVMFALGGPVRGGKVYAQWPGLEPEQLNEGRDLALTTDFRDVFAEVVVRHLGGRQPSSVFPGFPVSSSRFRGFLS